eukprot:9472608-Pyramimonas_sp.AAC.1
MVRSVSAGGVALRVLPEGGGALRPVALRVGKSGGGGGNGPAAPPPPRGGARGRRHAGVHSPKALKP